MERGESDLVQIYQQINEKAPGIRNQCAEQRYSAQQVRKANWVTLFGFVSLPVQKNALFYFKYKKKSLVMNLVLFLFSLCNEEFQGCVKKENLKTSEI